MRYGSSNFGSSRFSDGGYRGYGFGGYGFNGPYRYGYGYGNRSNFGFGLGSSFITRILFGLGGYGGFGYGGLGWGGLGYGGWGYGGYGGLGYGGWGYGGYGFGPYRYGYGFGGFDDFGQGYAVNAYPLNTTYYSPTYVENTVVETPASDVPPPNPTAAVEDYATLGEAAFFNGDYEGAVRLWQHALVDDPQNATLVLLIGQAMFAQGKYDEAAGAVEAAMQAMPVENWNVVAANAAELYASPTAYADQVRTLEASAAQTPSPAKSFLLGYYHGYLGDAARAVRDLDQGLAATPQDASMRRLRDVMQGIATGTPVPAVPQ